MKKSTLTLLLFILGISSSFSVGAQEAKTVFVNIPDSLCPLLSSVNRADCIDFIESKMKAQVTNRFGGKSEMTELSPDYVSLQMSDASNWQMKLLPLNDTTKVVCAVSTVCAPACDSHIRFYTTDWKELPATDFLPSVPQMNDFFTSSDSTDYDFIDARLQADMTLMQAELSKENGTLTFTLTTPEYMEKETAEKLKPFLRRSIVYTQGWEVYPRHSLMYASISGVCSSTLCNSLNCALVHLRLCSGYLIL